MDPSLSHSVARVHVEGEVELCSFDSLTLQDSIHRRACGKRRVHFNALVTVGETFEKYTSYFSEYDRTSRYRRGKILTEADRAGILADVENIRVELFPSGNIYGDAACKNWNLSESSIAENTSKPRSASLPTNSMLSRAQSEPRAQTEVVSKLWAQRFISKLNYNYQRELPKRRNSIVSNIRCHEEEEKLFEDGDVDSYIRTLSLNSVPVVQSRDLCFPECILEEVDSQESEEWSGSDKERRVISPFYKNSLQNRIFSDDYLRGTPLDRAQSDGMQSAVTWIRGRGSVKYEYSGLMRREMRLKVMLASDFQGSFETLMCEISDQDSHELRFRLNEDCDVIFFREHIEHPLVDLVGGSPCLLVVSKEDLSITERASRFDMAMGKAVQSHNLSIQTEIVLECKPIPFGQGRLLLGDFLIWRNKQNSFSGFESIPFWIYCARNCGMMENVFLGGQSVCGLDAQQKTQILQTIEQSGYTMNTLPNLRNYIAEFEEIQCVREPDVFVQATYDLLRGAPSEEDSSVVSILASWPRPVRLLENPGLSATVCLYLRIVPGNPHSPVFSSFKEIQSLQQANTALSAMSTEPHADKPTCIQTDTDANSSPDTPTHKESIDPEAFKALMSMFYDQLSAIGPDSGIPSNLERVGSSVGTDVVNDDHEFLSSAYGLLGGRSFTYRTNYDFTERLWLFICTRGWMAQTEYLVRVISSVCEKILSGTLSPHVHSDNTSIFAKLIRRTLQLTMKRTGSEWGLVLQAFDELCVPKNALKCIVEVGVDKLHRDFLQVFLGANITTAPELNAFVLPSLELGEKVQGLTCLHNVLEIMGSEYGLNIPRELLKSVIASAITYYKSNKSCLASIIPSFTVQCQSFTSAERHIKSLCVATKMSTWAMTIRHPGYGKSTPVPENTYTISVQPTLRFGGDDMWNTATDTPMPSLNGDAEADNLPVMMYIKKKRVHSWKQHDGPPR
eukprot:CFRG7720T1